MIRLLNPAPAAYDLPQLHALAAVRFGAAFADANIVIADDGSPQIAVYLSAAAAQPTQDAWAADLTGYTVTHPTSAEMVANQAALFTKALAALSTNATFLGLSSPTNAQTLAQVQALTKECTAVIRLLLGQFDSTTGI